MRRGMLEIVFGLTAAALWGGLTGPAAAQVDYGTRLGLQQGDKTTFAPQGPGVMLGVTDPAMRKWYVPQELYTEYQWRQWEATNYARNHYRRYVDISLEGDSYYDLYGNFLTRGWLIFNNSQTRPQQFGNSLLKSDLFQNWFSDLVVASDSKGQYFYTLTFSSQLRSVLTPMTFSKPRMDGVQFDLATDRYEGTLIYSRISSPGGSTTRDQEVLRTNNTTLFGGRFAMQIGEFVEVGVHGINAHQSNTLSDKLVGNPLSGELTVAQNRTVGLIQVVLRDDSPGDGEGGAAYFPAGSDIVITYEDGTVEFGKDIQFEPIVEGGFIQQGFIAANGTEEIHLSYNFDNPSFADNASFLKEDIVEIEFRLVLGNDYQVWVTSDRQVNLDGEAVLLLVDQAEGNVKDVTNLKTVSFEYGLPTATNILGGNLEVRDLRGFDVYAEYNLNWNYRKYPNSLRETHRTFSGTRDQRAAPAWMVNVAKRESPWFLFGEAYSMDPLYNTRTFVTSGSGQIDYDSERGGIIELVEDNDDHDRFPDTVRRDWLQGDPQVFPGWDQNNDFVPDINQNDNFVRPNSVPDYEEPFFRFHVDRPEFLFGVDMNNNFWVDQFENDEEPDYPYGKDHQGYNIYGGVDVTPETKVTVGVLREELISSDHKNHSTYALLTHDVDSPRFGRLRFFEMSKLVEDTIEDPLLQWAPNNTLRGGELTKVDDPLLARETWINQVFAGHSLQTASWNFQTKVNWVLFHQMMNKTRRQEFGLNASDFFFGVVNKASYRYNLGNIVLEPRWKSEFRKQSRSLFTLDSTTRLMELLSALVETRVLRSTHLQTGVEYLLFNDFDVDENDFNELTVAFQFTNQSDYLGYKLHALAGLRLSRKDYRGQKAQTRSQTFITLYAGLN